MALGQELQTLTEIFPPVDVTCRCSVCPPSSVKSGEPSFRYALEILWYHLTMPEKKSQIFFTMTPALEERSLWQRGPGVYTLMRKFQ